MDPTAIALAMGLQQAEAATPAAAPVPAAPSLLDRCENQPLFRIEGEPVRMDLTAGAWIARLRGNASYGPISTVQQDVNTAYGLDTMEGAFQGDLSLMWRNWWPACVRPRWCPRSGDPPRPRGAVASDGWKARSAKARRRSRGSGATDNEGRSSL